MEVDEDCFSTNKTHGKHEGGPGFGPNVFGSGHRSKGSNKADITITEFTRQEENNRSTENGFRVISERTDEAETSRADVSQTSIGVPADQLKFTFQKGSVDENSQDRRPTANYQKPNTRTDSASKDRPKVFKKSTKTVVDKGRSTHKYGTPIYPWHERSIDKKLKTSDKDLGTHASRSKSNCDTERKDQVRILKDGDWKHKSYSKRFFKSFRDILQRQGYPGIAFSAKTIKAIETIQRGREERGNEHLSFRDRYSPDLADRSLDFPRKSKSYLKLK